MYQKRLQIVEETQTSTTYINLEWRGKLVDYKIVFNYIARGYQNSNLGEGIQITKSWLAVWYMCYLAKSWLAVWYMCYDWWVPKDIRKLQSLFWKHHENKSSWFIVCFRW